jgi:hypothetical protein
LTGRTIKGRVLGVIGGRQEEKERKRGASDVSDLVPPNDVKMTSPYTFKLLDAVLESPWVGFPMPLVLYSQKWQA